MAERPRFLTLFAFFLATGLLAFAFLSLTVYRRAEGRLSSDAGAVAGRAIVEHWLQRGYFASHGLLMAVPGRNIVYRWSSGAYFVTTWIAERIWIGITGRYGWRVAAAHNALVAMLVSALVGVLSFRFALRLGALPRHALVLGVAAQMVQLTFPDNLALYWLMHPQVWWLLFAVAFLLAEEGSLIAGVCVFAMTEMEWMQTTMFLAAYALAVLLLRGERPPLRRLVTVLAVPYAIAMAITAMQWTAAKHDPALTVAGSSFAYRSGLDGDTALYGTHADIAFGRDAVRSWRAGHHELLFHWPVLFLAGSAAALVAIAAYLRGRAPRSVAIALVSLIGSYILFAAVFSQSVAVEPYLYDVLLATPLIVALFAVVPALAESATQHSGAFTLIAFLAAFWTAMMNLRVYAVVYASP